MKILLMFMLIIIGSSDIVACETNLDDPIIIECAGCL